MPRSVWLFVCLFVFVSGSFTRASELEAVSFQQIGPRLAAARVKNWISGYKQPGPAVSGSGTLTATNGAKGWC